MQTRCSSAPLKPVLYGKELGWEIEEWNCANGLKGLVPFPALLAGFAIKG